MVDSPKTQQPKQAPQPYPTLSFPTSDFVHVAQDKAAQHNGQTPSPSDSQPLAAGQDQPPARRSRSRWSWLSSRGAIHSVFIEGLLIWPGFWYLLTSEVVVLPVISSTAFFLAVIVGALLLLRSVGRIIEYLAVFLQFLDTSNDFDPYEAIASLLVDIKRLRRVLISVFLSLIGLGLAMLL